MALGACGMREEPKKVEQIAKGQNIAQDEYKQKTFILTPENASQYDVNPYRSETPTMPIVGVSNVFNNITELVPGKTKFNPLVYDKKGNRMNEPVDFGINRLKRMPNKMDIKFKLEKLKEENGVVIDPPKILFEHIFTNWGADCLIRWIEINRIVCRGSYPHKDGGYIKTPRRPRNESYRFGGLNEKNIFGTYNVEIEYIFQDLKMKDKLILKGIEAIREPINDFAHRQGVYIYFSGDKIK